MARPSAVNVSGLNFEMGPPDAFGRWEWMDILKLEREAFGAALPERSSAEIDHMLGVIKVDPDDATSPTRYLPSRLDPGLDVETGEQKPRQQFSAPLVLVALDRDTPVGYMYSANNTSGNFLVASLKAFTASRNYIWVRELAVSPLHQGRGLAKVMGSVSLGMRNQAQPVAAYVRDEANQLEVAKKGLEAVGFSETGREPKQVYGSNRFGVMQIRFAAPSAGLVRAKIAESPSAIQAITRIEESLKWRDT
jgi:GNAT superfamily N-acetyltransferase